MLPLSRGTPICAGLCTRVLSTPLSCHQIGHPWQQLSPGGLCGQKQSRRCVFWSLSIPRGLYVPPICATCQTKGHRARDYPDTPDDLEHRGRARWSPGSYWRSDVGGPRARLASQCPNQGRPDTHQVRQNSVYACMVFLD